MSAAKLSLLDDTLFKIHYLKMARPTQTFLFLRHFYFPRYNNKQQSFLLENFVIKINTVFT